MTNDTQNETCGNCKGEGGFDDGMCMQCEGSGTVPSDDPFGRLVDNGYMPEHWTEGDLKVYLVNTGRYSA